MSSRKRHDKSTRFDREAKGVRRWMRRRLRQVARMLMRKGKSDSIERERKTQGWETW